ncbi:MAG: hypothetical protein ABI232_06705, partial [Jatrophihabitantaceae bacterium]
MSFWRFLPSAAAIIAVAGGAVVAVGMSRADGHEPMGSTTATTAPSTDNPLAAYLYLPSALPAAGNLATSSAAKATAANSTARAATTKSPSAPTSRPPATHAPPQVVAERPATTSAVNTPKPGPVTGRALPLRYSTGTATRVITVLAHSTGSTTATLQAWDKAPGGGWLPRGAAVTANIGSDGMSPTPSESRSATPMGSF